MATKSSSIKLMINPESNKVIFAESSKDFVDFLIFLLSLPIATAIKLLTTESMVAGSFGNLYTSVANLNETYLQPNINKNVLLNPFVFSSLSTNNIPLSITRASIISSGKFYTCGESNCKKRGMNTLITNLPNAASCPAPGCLAKMNQEIDFSGSGIFETRRIMDKDSKGYVKQETSYMITDDLSVSVISTMSILSIMNKFNVSKLEEKKVEIGNEEALELLKTTFKSTTVLTDVFLKMKKKIKKEKDDKGKSKDFSASKMDAEKTAKDVNYNKAKRPNSGFVTSEKAPKKKANNIVKKPKPPVSTTFFVFMEEFRKTYRGEYPKNRSGPAFAIAAGEKWRQMSEAEKAPYQAESDKRKNDYEKELVAYYKALANGSGVKEEEENEDNEDCVIIVS